jgi:hypothetical protein
MSYERPRTRTEEAIERIKNEESLTRAIRKANIGGGNQRSSSGSGSLVDGLVFGAITLVFYGIYHLFRGLFLALRWAFRKLVARWS